MTKICAHVWLKDNLQHIPLHLIDAEDKIFCFAEQSATEIEALRRSIVQLGVIDPLVVQPGQKYRIISGFTHFSIARDLGFSSLPAWVLRDELSDSQILTVALLAHSRPLSLIEKIRVIKTITTLKVSSTQIPQLYASFLDIHSHQLIELYRRVSNYEPSLLSYISNHGLSLKQALVFEGLSCREQTLLVSLATSLSLKGYDLYDILTHLKEIAMREGKKVLQVIQELGLGELSTGSKLTRSQKIAKMKEMIKSKRYPWLTEINKELIALNRRMKFASSSQISWDHRLEEAGLKLILKITDPAYIQMLMNDLSNKENITILSRMLRLYYEGRLSDKEGMD